MIDDGSLSAAPVIMPRPIDFWIGVKDNFVCVEYDPIFFSILIQSKPIDLYYTINLIFQHSKIWKLSFSFIFFNLSQ